MKNSNEINFDVFPDLQVFLQATTEEQMKQALLANPLQASYLLGSNELPEYTLSICVALNKWEHVNFLLKQTEFRDEKIVLRSLFTRLVNLFSNKTNLPGLEEAIEQAIRCAHVQILADLLETNQGKQIIKTDYLVWNLMRLAIANGQKSVIDYLIDQEEIVNTLDQEHNYWPYCCLFDALKSGQIELFNQLLQMDVFYRFAANFNNNLLYLAIVNCQYDAIACLLKIPAVVETCRLDEGFIWFLPQKNDLQLVDIFLPVYEEYSVHIDPKALNIAFKDAFFYITNTEWSNDDQRDYFAKRYVIALKLLSLNLSQNNLMQLGIEEINKTLLPLLGLIASHYLVQKMDIGSTEAVEALRPCYSLLHALLENPVIFNHLSLLTEQNDSRYVICCEDFVQKKLTDLKRRYDLHKKQHAEVEFNILAEEIPLFLEIVRYLLKNGESLEDLDMRRLFTLPAIQKNFPQLISNINDLKLIVNSQECFTLLAVPGVKQAARHTLISGIHRFFTNVVPFGGRDLERPSVLRPVLIERMSSMFGSMR